MVWSCFLSYVCMSSRYWYRFLRWWISLHCVHVNFIFASILVPLILYTIWSCEVWFLIRELNSCSSIFVASFVSWGSSSLFQCSCVLYVLFALYVQYGYTYVTGAIDCLRRYRIEGAWYSCDSWWGFLSTVCVNQWLQDVTLYRVPWLISFFNCTAVCCEECDSTH